MLNHIRSDVKSILETYSSGQNKEVYIEVSKQSFLFNFGVHICSFAQQVLKKVDYKMTTDMYGFHRGICDALVGGCLKRQQTAEEKSEKCF